MQKETLKYIADSMAAANIPYDFMEFDGDITDRYWVGEYQENESMNEDGQDEAEFILTGTARNLQTLETDKQSIRTLFPAIGGKMATLNNGSTVAIFYGNAVHIPTGDYLHKRMQINLKIKEWKVN